MNALSGFEVVDYSTAGFRAELDFLPALGGRPDLLGKWTLRVIATKGARGRGGVGASRA